MSDTRAKGCLIAAVIWCVILAALGIAYKFLVHPYLREKLAKTTGGASQYKQELVVMADSFSGYAVLRSELLKEQLKSQQLRLTVQDDKGDTAARLKALQEGRAQFGVFTIDSLITAGDRLGDFPATIVLVIDETKGSDAIVAYKSGVGSLQDLNHRDAQMVLTPNSPSEFLARVVTAHFNLPNLGPKWMASADGAKAVYGQFRAAKPADRKAFVLWEPYVSKALEQPGAHVLLDSSRLKGYIVDVLVAQREFLRDHPEKARAVVEAYCRAAYGYSQQPEGLVNLVREDARRTGAETLDEAQAKQVVQGIRWKNTLENYAHFGLLSGAAEGGLSHLEDVIANIMDVLLKTKALSADPLPGKHNTLFYQETLKELRAANFHPAKGLNLIPGLSPNIGELEKVRSEAEAKALTPEQWDRLQAVGELKVEPIVFVRGSASISVQSERDLQALARRLKSFPRFYVRVIGHTRAEGDPEANRVLAQSRAEAAAQYLRSQGIGVERVRTDAAPATVESGEAQAVSFLVGQVPY
jgi:ABC-type nitrate/sulfonate/bicarbonate transport system substrate-binding protein